MFLKIKYADKGITFKQKYDSQTLADLLKSIHEKCGIEPGLKVELTYIDSENDRITVETTEDLQNAFEDVKSQPSEKGLTTLIVEVSTSPFTAMNSVITFDQAIELEKPSVVVEASSEQKQDQVFTSEFSESFINPPNTDENQPAFEHQDLPEPPRAHLNHADSTMTSLNNQGTDPTSITVANTGTFQFGQLPPVIPTTDYPEESTFKEDGEPHLGISCSQCFCAPIVGTRWRLVEKNDFDLCGKCAVKPEYKDLLMFKIPRHDPRQRCFDNKNFEAIVHYFQKDGGSHKELCQVESPNKRFEDTRKQMLLSTMRQLLPQHDPARVTAFLDDYIKDPLKSVQVEILIEIYLKSTAIAGKPQTNCKTAKKDNQGLTYQKGTYEYNPSSHNLSTVNSHPAPPTRPGFAPPPHPPMGYPLPGFHPPFGHMYPGAIPHVGAFHYGYGPHPAYQPRRS